MKNYFCFFFFFLSLSVYSQDSSNKIMAKIVTLINNNRIYVNGKGPTKLYLNKSTKTLDYDGEEINLKHCTFVYGDFFDETKQKTFSSVSFKCDDNFDCISNSTSSFRPCWCSTPQLK